MALPCLFTSAIGQHNVKISVSLVNNSIKELRIADFNYVIQKDTVYAKAKLSAGNRFFFSFHIDKPIIARLLNNQIFISPNDDVSIVLNKENNIETVKGNNRMHYQFNTLLKTRFDSKALVFKSEYRNDLFRYKQILTDDYHHKLNLIDSLDTKHAFTPEFTAYTKTELYYLYLDRLMLGGSLPPSKMLPEGYISRQFNDYFNSALCEIGTYAKVLNKWVNYFNDTIPVKKESLSFKFDYSLKALNGCDREIIQMMTLRDIWMTNINDVGMFDSLYAIANQHIKNPVFRQELLYMNSFFHLTNQPLPPHTLGNMLTFKEVLQKNKGKILYVDFWATWCSPCIEELPDLLRLSESYRPEGLEVLSISVDSDWNDWMKYKKKYKLVNQHYWLLGDFKSDLAKAIHLSAIPRHIIISAEGNLISLYPSKAKDLSGFRRNFDRIKQMLATPKGR